MKNYKNHPLYTGGRFINWNWIWREWVCFLIGHDIKRPKPIKTQYFGMDECDVPFSARTSGNYMWAPPSTWDAKCRRCRQRWTDDRTIIERWYMVVLKNVWWSIPIGKRSYSSFNFFWKYCDDLRSKTLLIITYPIFKVLDVFRNIVVGLMCDTDYPVSVLLDLIEPLWNGYHTLILKDDVPDTTD